MASTRAKQASRITRALSHYEAALSLFQEELASADPATKMKIEEAVVQEIQGKTNAWPTAMTTTIIMHEAGDVLRAAKTVLDPEAVLSSSTPALT